MDIKRKFKYYWVQFKMQMQGGYKEIKRIYSEIDVIRDIKAVLKRWDEEEAYEKEQKRLRKKEILKPGDIIEFRQPNFQGNIIKARVLEVEYIQVIGVREVHIEILETGLRKETIRKFYYQDDILNNLIKLEKEE